MHIYIEREKLLDPDHRISFVINTLLLNPNGIRKIMVGRLMDGFAMSFCINIWLFMDLVCKLKTELKGRKQSWGGDKN